MDFAQLAEKFGPWVAASILLAGFIAMIVREMMAREKMRQKVDAERIENLGKRLDEVAAEALKRELRIEARADTERELFLKCRSEILDACVTKLAEASNIMARIEPAMERNSDSVDRNSKILSEAVNVIAALSEKARYG